MLTRQLKNFAVAGISGFLTDVGVLYLANLLDIGLYVGRVISFLCAVFVTWQINRRFTFVAYSQQSTWCEWWRYLSAMIFGGLVNFSAYAVTLHIAPANRWTALIGVAIGSGFAMVVNFVSSKFWVFEQKL